MSEECRISISKQWNWFYIDDRTLSRLIYNFKFQPSVLLHNHRSWYGNFLKGKVSDDMYFVFIFQYLRVFYIYIGIYQNVIICVGRIGFWWFTKYCGHIFYIGYVRCMAFPVNYFMNIYVVVVFFCACSISVCVRCVRINACHRVRMGARVDICYLFRIWLDVPWNFNISAYELAWLLGRQWLFLLLILSIGAQVCSSTSTEHERTFLFSSFMKTLREMEIVSLCNAVLEIKIYWL